MPRPRKSTSKARAASSVTRTLHVLSDSTGNLAQHMLTATLTQFPTDSLEVRLWPFLKHIDEVTELLPRIERAGGAVVHAIVSPVAKKLVDEFCFEKQIPCLDLTGPLATFLERVIGVGASNDPDRLHRFDALYHRRIAAMEFTLDHDDGMGIDTIHQADIVLAGVSRTSKTPTSILLAQYGYRVANVSLAIQLDPPRQLLEMDPKKVIGLMIDPTQLVQIRMRRSLEWQLGQTDYNDPDFVKREISWTRQLFGRQGWRVLDVSHHAVEETAARVLYVMGLPRLAPAK